MIVRRTLLMVATATLVATSIASPGHTKELNDILDDARYSTYTASRLVVSVWEGQTQVAREFVEHSNGVEKVRRDAGWSIAGNGRAVTMGVEPSGVTFLTKSNGSPLPSSKYTIRESGAGIHMSRLCHIVEVMEGEIHRATFILDQRTGAILVAEMFDGEGELFRRTTLSNFRAYRTHEAPIHESTVPVEVVLPESAFLLPATAAGYRLVEAFSAPGGSEQGYYTDGLFSFSLFILDRETVVSGFEGAMQLELDSGVYDIAPTANAVRVHWVDGSNQYVLVGDLPPDHLADVLSELSWPETRGVWARWWSRLFG